jgi:DNA polymerase-3 subunit beta
MKITLARQEFQDALSAVAALTSGRTTKPIFACVRLEAHGDRLELSATDGEAGLRANVTALSLKRPGQAVVQAARLLDIVREMSDVEIALEADERSCHIRGEGSEFKIYVSDPADFPPVAGFDDEPDLRLDGLALKRMIGLTIHAAARETSRFAINGVLWEKEGKRLYLVATDGRRLARAGGPVRDSRTNDFQVIIPAKVLMILDKIFPQPKDPSEWHIDVKILPNQALLRSGGRVLSTILVEGLFPKYQEVVPRDNDKRARLNRNELHGAIRRAALLTTEESRAVRLSFGKNQLIITSQAPEQGEARVQIPAQYDGSPIDIGFNPAFLADALRAVTYDDVYFEMKEGFRPGVLCGEDKSEFLYVVMPVSLT